MLVLLDPAKMHGSRRSHSVRETTWRYICSSWYLCGTSMDLVAYNLHLLQRHYRFRSRRSVQDAMELRARRASPVGLWATPWSCVVGMYPRGVRYPPMPH